MPLWKTYDVVIETTVKIISDGGVGTSFTVKSDTHQADSASTTKTIPAAVNKGMNDIEKRAGALARAVQANEKDR